MTIKITKSQTGNRRVRLSARFNDESGHVDILDMLQDYDKKKWTQSQVMQTALVLLLDEWRKNPTHPISPSAEYVSQEMLELVKKAQQALDRTNEILQLVIAGGLSNGDAQALQKEITNIKGNLDLDIVEGAGNYAGEINIKEDNDDFGEWD